MTEAAIKQNGTGNNIILDESRRKNL